MNERENLEVKIECLTHLKNHQIGGSYRPHVSIREIDAIISALIHDLESMDGPSLGEVIGGSMKWQSEAYEARKALETRIDQLTSANADLRAHVAEVERRATRMQEVLRGIIGDIPPKPPGMKYVEVQFRDGEIQEILDAINGTAKETT